MAKKKSISEDKQNELVFLRRELLNRHFIHKKQFPQLFNEITRNKHALTKFFNDHMRFRLEVGEDFAKLEKFADFDTNKNWMKIKTTQKNHLSSKTHFILLSLSLAFLDEEGTGKQFLLNDLVEFLSNNYLQLFDEKLTFEKVGEGTINRNALVEIIKFLAQQDFVEIVDEEFDSFSKGEEGEALLKVLRNSNHFLHSLFTDLGNVHSKQDLIDTNPMRETYFNTPANVQIIRRLSFSATVKMDELNDDELFFLRFKHNRNSLFEFFEKELDCHIEFYDSMILKLTKTNNQFDTFFTRENSEEKLLLFLLEKVKQENITLLSLESLQHLTIEIIKERKVYLSSTVKELKNEKLLQLITSLIEEWGVGRISNNEVRFNLLHQRFFEENEQTQNTNGMEILV